MRRTKTTESEYLECDGCKYVMGLTREERDAGERVEWQTITLRVPWDTDPVREEDHVWLEFHFHMREGRHDCFRYWAHNPRVMRDSLESRELSGPDIEQFMSTMLYRDQIGFGPGVERPKEKV